MGDPPLDREELESLQHLKRVSRIKLIILQKYFPPWAVILGSQHEKLCYFDCFAGPGRYELEGSAVEGSPLIAVRGAKDFLEGRPRHRLVMLLVEDDEAQAANLRASLKRLGPFPDNLEIDVRHADSRSYLPALLVQIKSIAPSFFFVDPYGHPLSLPVINDILARPRTEVLINLMWFRINMDLGNPLMVSQVNDLFGDDDWKRQPFMQLHGLEREQSFLSFFRSRLDAKYMLRFTIRYDVEDRRGGGRTKYWLLHASNHVKAVLLMKEVMWPLGDEEGTFDYSGESQGILISQAPTVQELHSILQNVFAGKELEFDALREETWELPFIEKHYREALRYLEGKGVVIDRVTSKKTGIKGRDRIRFV